MGVVPAEHGKDCRFVLRDADLVEDELDYECAGVAVAIGGASRRYSEGDARQVKKPATRNHALGTGGGELA